MYRRTVAKSPSRSPKSRRTSWVGGWLRRHPTADFIRSIRVLDTPAPIKIKTRSQTDMVNRRIRPCASAGPRSLLGFAIGPNPVKFGWRTVRPRLRLRLIAVKRSSSGGLRVRPHGIARGAIHWIDAEDVINRRESCGINGCIIIRSIPLGYGPTALDLDLRAELPDAIDAYMCNLFTGRLEGFIFSCPVSHALSFGIDYASDLSNGFVAACRVIAIQRLRSCLLVHTRRRRQRGQRRCVQPITQAGEPSGRMALSFLPLVVVLRHCDGSSLSVGLA